MNKLTALLFCLMLSIGLIAQKPFEGVLKMDMVNPSINEKSTLIWHVKAGKHMMEINSVTNDLTATYSLYLDNSLPNIKMLATANGQTLLYTIPAAQIQSKLAPGTNVKVTKTDESKTIAGKKCQKAVLEDSKGKTVIWVTDDLNINTKSLPEGFKNGSLLTAFETNGITGYPLVIIATDLSGKLIYSQIFTSISEESISDDTFSVPAGVNTFEESMKFKTK